MTPLPIGGGKGQHVKSSGRDARETGTAGLLSTVLAARAKWCFFPDA